jgi:hypothetical protein
MRGRCYANDVFNGPDRACELPSGACVSRDTHIAGLHARRACRLSLAVIVWQEALALAPGVG